MKMNLNAEGIYLGASAQESKDKVYYNVSVLCNNEAGTIPATEAVYCACMSGKIAQFDRCNFMCSYNDAYKFLQVIGIDTID